MRNLNSRSSENVKGEAFGHFQHLFSCKKSQKLKGDLLATKKFEKESHKAGKRAGKSHTVKKIEKGDPSTLEWFLRGFGCVQNQVLGTFVKAHSAQKVQTG